MSPRAACRLERFGFDPVYDYTAGKAGWRAAGLLTEGRPQPARVLAAADRTPMTCAPDVPVASVLAQFTPVGRAVCVVVDTDGVVCGRLRLDQLDPSDHRPAEAVMEPGPTTVRADAPLDETLARMARRHVASLLITTPEGVLLGELRRSGDDTSRSRRRPAPGRSQWPNGR
jgi:CBS domain-containing protein